jgi:capsid assembly protease
MMNKASELRRMLCATAWAVQPEYLRSMFASVELLMSGGAVAEHTIAALKASNEIAAARRKEISASTGGSVVVLPLYGLISQRSDWASYFFGGTTIEGFTAQFRQALADPNVTAIIIDVDSPGGSVSGVDELAAEIYAARGKKTIVAISNTLNASAALYISSAAGELVVMPSSLTGSIGVYNTHEDDSEYLAKLGIKITLVSAGKFKVEGNQFEPLDAVGLAAAQALVDGYYAAFVKAIAKFRGVKVAEVTGGFGEGRVLMAADAVASGMADRVGTLDSVLAKFGVKRPIETTSYAAIVEAPVAEAPVAAGPSAVTGDAAILAAKKAEKKAAKKAAKADDDTDDDDNDVGDDSGDDADDPMCACACAPCVAGDCSGCTADDCDAENCDCAAAIKQRTDAKATADHKHALALQEQSRQISLAL